MRARAVLAPLSHRGVDVGDCPIRDRPGRPRLIELICLMQRQPSAGKVEHHQLRSSGNRCGTKPRRIPRRRSGKISDEVEDISWRTQSCGHAICLVHEAKRRTPAGDRHRRPAAAQIPAALRRRCGLRAGDHVLLAASPGQDTLAAYSFAVVDQAMRAHALVPAEGRQP